MKAGADISPRWLGFCWPHLPRNRGAFCARGVFHFERLSQTAVAAKRKTYHPVLVGRTILCGLPAFGGGRSSQCPISRILRADFDQHVPVVSEYLRLLLGIPPFCADYNYLQSEPPHPFLSVWVLEGCSWCAFGVLAAWLWRLPRWRMSAFRLIWIALFMLPVPTSSP